MDPQLITLLIVQSRCKGKTIGFQPGSTTRIGQVMYGNNFPIKDNDISSKHLTIESGSAKWILWDLRSSNGMTLNSIILPAETPFDLYDDNTLKLGETRWSWSKLNAAEETKMRWRREWRVGGGIRQGEVGLWRAKQRVLIKNWRRKKMLGDAAKLQVHNIVSSNKVINKVSFPRGLDKTNTKIIVNLQLFG